MHIHDNAASKRTPVLYDQARLLAMLIKDLIRAYERRRGMDIEAFFALPEYERFVVGAYACGFVCRDYSSGNGKLFELAKTRPREHLSSCSFRTLRHFLHILLRAERWAGHYSSHVREALDSGALDVVATRLENDPSLREPEVKQELVAEIEHV